MIDADVFFPALNRSYEFSLATDVEIRVIISELVGIISQTEKLTAMSSTTALVLFDVIAGVALHPNATLGNYGIGNGSSLLLV